MLKSKRSRYTRKFLFKLYFMFLLLGICAQASARIDIHLPFINGADLGNAYAGWSAYANDASTGYTNPAGLVRIPKPQLVFSGVGLIGRILFTGTTSTPFSTPQNGSVSSPLKGLIPSFYFASPLTDKVYVGLGLNAPFGLGDYYGKRSLVRYENTRTTLAVTDLSPSIAFQANKQFSMGLGIDIERMFLHLGNMFGQPFSIPDSEGQNNVSGWGYGAHAGLLYKFNEQTRVGLSYNSQAVFNLSGSSAAFTPLGRFKTNDQKITITLPAFAQIGFFHDICQQWEIMGTIFYTQWSSIKQLVLKNLMLPTGSTIRAETPLNYHDTVDYAIGLNYNTHAQWLFRTGVQYTHAPSNNQNRLISDPSANSTIVGLGARYQQNACIVYDLSYGHYFIPRSQINLSSALKTSTGRARTSIDVLGLQVTWNL